MNIVEKVYGQNGIYNKLKEIKFDKFQLKDSYQSIIPLNIYLTWSNKDLPPKMKENVEKLKRDNPEFNIQIFDCNERREFIKSNFPNDILKAYDTLVPGAYKADLWRLCILYINGGIYLDIKANCINNFKLIALTEREHYAIDRVGDHWKENNIGLSNAVIATKPKNEFLLKCINKINENVKTRNYCYNDLYPSGPGLMGEEYIKMLKEDESTIESKLNELDLVHEYEKYYFNNVMIIDFYKEYRDEQKMFASTKQNYHQLYFLKQIYKDSDNLIKEGFENNINIICKDTFLTFMIFLIIAFILLVLIKKYLLYKININYIKTT